MFRKFALAAFAATVGMVAAATLTPDRHRPPFALGGPRGGHQPSGKTGSHRGRPDVRVDRRSDARPVHVASERIQGCGETGKR